MKHSFTVNSQCDPRDLPLSSITPPPGREGPALDRRNRKYEGHRKYVKNMNGLYLISKAEVKVI